MTMCRGVLLLAHGFRSPVTAFSIGKWPGEGKCQPAEKESQVCGAVNVWIESEVVCCGGGWRTPGDAHCLLINLR